MNGVDLQPGYGVIADPKDGEIVVYHVVADDSGERLVAQVLGKEPMGVIPPELKAAIDADLKSLKRVGQLPLNPVVIS